MNWLDWMLLAVLLLSALGGLARGFVRSVAGLAAAAFGFWVALRYYRPLGDYLESGLGWGPALTRYFTEHLGGAAGGIPAASSSPSVAPLEDLFTATTPALLHGLSQSLASAALDALAFLVIFAAGAGLLGMAVGAIPNLPLLAPLDRAGGFCFGLLRGFLLGVLLYALVQFVAAPGVPFGGNVLDDAVRHSLLAPSYKAALNYLRALITPARG